MTAPHGETVRAAAISPAAPVQTGEASPALPGADDRQRIDRLWVWALHEDSLFDSRQQTFLTAHTLLFAAASVLFQKDMPLQPLLVCIAFIGALLGGIWIIVQRRAANTVDALERELEKDAIYKSITDSLQQKSWKRLPKAWSSQTWILSRTIPLIVTVAWVLFLGFFVMLTGSASP